MTDNEILTRILDAREKRAALRSDLAKQNYNTLSLSLNIPGYPKSNSLISEFFELVLDELKIFLEANRIQILSHTEIYKKDEAGDFYLTAVSDKNFDTIKIKNITEKFEKNHTIGRLVDIDIFDTETKLVSSGKQKMCYFCGKYPAISCMREKRHTYSEIREKIFSDILNYMQSVKKEDFIKQISSLALKAVLYEVSVTPKPGLVDFNNTGSHSDMNYFTFLNSSASLSAYFREFCLSGFEKINDYEDVLPKIRTIGLQCEKAMYDATNGVNTQKGLIFLLGICLFSFSVMKAEEMEFSENNFRNIVRKITKDIVKKELQTSVTLNQTHGENVFLKYGNIGAGVRYEVQSGFNTVFKTALPYLKEHSTDENKNREDLQKILVKSLLLIISENNDSNILYRSDIETLNEIKKRAEKSIDNFEEYKKFCDYCKIKNVSPGGSADLLAVSIFIHFVFNKFRK